MTVDIVKYFVIEVTTVSVLVIIIIITYTGSRFTSIFVIRLSNAFVILFIFGIRKSK